MSRRDDSPLPYRQRPSLRLAVAVACALIALLFFPLVWHITHSYRQCEVISASYLRGGQLQNHAIQLNDAITRAAHDRVRHPELPGSHEPELLATQLSDKLYIAKLARQSCTATCALDRADSFQVAMRAIEADAVEQARQGHIALAGERLESATYDSLLAGFRKSIATYVEGFKGDVQSIVIRERLEEYQFLVWSLVIVGLSAAMWIVLLRVVVRWRRATLAEIETRRQAETELEAAVQRFRTLFHEAGDSIFLVEESGHRILDANRVAADRLGYDRERLLRMNLEDFEIQGPTTPEQAASSRELAEAGEIVERHHHCSDGTTRIVEVSRRRIRDDGTDVILCVARDVTDRRHLEAQLTCAQKMECVGGLAAGIAHDFGNTVLAISAHALVLRNLLRRDMASIEVLTQLELAIEQAAGTVQSLLYFANQSAASRQPVEAGALFEAALRLIKPAMPAAVTVVVSRRLPGRLWIRANPNRLQQAIVNLALNARDAMPEGGRIDLNLSFQPANDDEAPGALRISIADTGPGIPPELVDRVCEPFFTTKPPDAGSGLGLFNVRCIAEECDGHLEIESGPGQGAKFTLDIPVINRPDGHDDALARPGTEASARSGTILLAEAQQFTRSIISEALASEGYGVVVAGDMRKALALLRTEEDRYQLLVLDSNIHEGNAIELLRLIRTSAPCLPAIVLTSIPADDLASQADEATRILAKPFTMQVLTRLVASTLGEWARESERS